MNYKDLKIKIFADGADKEGILEMYRNPTIKGFTTNPTLMRVAGVSDYSTFAKEILSEITDMPISFEVFSDDIDEMEQQAKQISAWGENVYVKVPVTNTKQESTKEIVKKLSEDGVKLNVTALFSLRQVEEVTKALKNGAPSNISVFAGRIADAGLDPIPIMRESLEIMKAAPQSELIWASPRELYNVVQADSIGCHIITVTNSVIKKLPTIGKDLEEFSLDTVKMFYNDAQSAGYKL